LPDERDTARRTRSRIPARVSTRRSTSPAVGSGPRLTRIEDAASPASPIAMRVGDRRIVPAEQAEPAETAIPSRSSAITSDSPLAPLHARLLVFGTRAADDPLTLTPGQRFVTASSRR